MKLVRLALFSAFFAPALWAFAQHSLEIIPLRHSSVDQVLPVLRPLLEPGASLAGQSGQLILRASPRNVAEIRRALEVIDADARSGSQERVDQRIQVLEGGRAYIATGVTRSQPVRQLIQTPAGVVAQDTFVVQETSSGFEISPRLSGDRVLLEVYAQREREAASPQGGVQTQRVSSTASAPLGEWFELGAVDERGSQEGRSLAAASGSSFSASRRLWIKVEALTDR